MKTGRFIFINFVFLLVGGALGYQIAMRRVKMGGSVEPQTQPDLPPAYTYPVSNHTLSSSRPRDAESKNPAAIAAKLNEFEKIMFRFYRDDPLDKTQARANRLVKDYNQWIKSGNGELQPQREKLRTQFKAVRQFHQKIEDLDKRLKREKPDSSNRGAVRAYNVLVSRRNRLVREHNQLGKDYKQSEKTFNDRVSRFNRKRDIRKARVSAAMKRAEDKSTAYRRWVEAKQDMAFWWNVNNFYARLYREKANDDSAAGMDGYIRKVRSMRHELGRREIRRQKFRKNGLIMVRAKLCRREDCFFIVDTGATLVTVSPSLVDALGLSGRTGKKITVSLAGGIQITAPELIIPRLSVFGMEARNVKAVVLNESQVGVDGLLGLSFLNNFNFQIAREQDPSLILKPK